LLIIHVRAGDVLPPLTPVSKVRVFKHGWHLLFTDAKQVLCASYFFVSLVLGPLNSLVWYVPSLRYTRGLGWRIHCGVEVNESNTNKQHTCMHVHRCIACIILHACMLPFTDVPASRWVRARGDNADNSSLSLRSF